MAVRPLDALQLGPRRAQEGGEAVAAARALGLGAGAPLGHAAGAAGLLDVVLDLVEPLVGELLGVRAGDVVAVAREPGVVGLGLAVGAGDERGLELVDLARGVLERPGDVLLVKASRLGPGVVVPAGSALLGALSVTGHGDVSR